MPKLKEYPRTFWVANTIEIFERMAWYGFFTLSSLYITGPVSEGCLGFTSEQRGVLQGVVTFILYLLPVLTGALADKFGFKKMLTLAFLILLPGYYLLGQAKSFWGFFAVFLFVALGAAVFKPSITGTIARTTNEKTVSFGFGIFYMMVNIGGFVGPVVAGIIRGWAWSWIFVMSSVWILVNLFLVTFLYKEPEGSRTAQARSLKQVWQGVVTVIGNGRLFVTVFGVIIMLIVFAKGWWGGKEFLLVFAGWVALNLLIDIPLRIKSSKQCCGGSWLTQPMRLGNWQFVLFLVLLSGFWVLYNQIFMTMPEYIRDFIDTTPILIFLRDAAGAIGLTGLYAIMDNSITTGYQINPEYLININGLTIILLQLVVTWAFVKRRPFFTMIAGILVTTVSMFMFILGAGPWIVVFGIVIFSIAEMMTSPKSQEYIALIAPKDKVAMFMGYYFVAVALGNLLGGVLSGSLYGWLARDLRRPDLMWMAFAILGAIVVLAFVIYNKLVISVAGKNLSRHDAHVVHAEDGENVPETPEME